jgi:hypothetical protein
VRRILVTAILAAALATGCTSTDPADPAGPAASSPTPTAPLSNDEIADRYARAHSDGETTGCSQAEPGPEAESHPGCIYSAAFAGCLHGLTGEQPAPLPIEDEFATEPALVELYHTARTECAG